MSLGRLSTVVVKRDEGVSETMMTVTPGHTPNVMLKAIHPVKIILIRTARVFVQSLAGSITVASITDLTSIRTAVIMSAAIAGVTFLQNTAELLAKLDQSFPEVRA